MSWKNQYLAYDQESLATYANAGLVRRALKDLAAEKVTLQQEQAEQVTILSDGQPVCLSSEGLVKAVCACPATGACKHIVAAVLWLQQQADSANTVVETGTQSSTEEATSKTTALENLDVIAEIMAFDLTQLGKKIGKAQTQKAIQLARLWQQEQQTELHIEQYRLTIHIKSVAEDIVYIAGTGFAGMLSNLERDQNAFYLAALSEVQRLHGKIWAELELKETENPAILTTSEQQFITELQHDLAQLLEDGLSHVNEMTARKLHILNLSARSESLPRLAAMLRQLSGQVSHLFKRDEHSSEQQCLLYLAKIYAYLYKLQHVQGEQRIELRGKVRRNYQLDEEQPDLELLPLGARWWNTLGGARGLSLYFSEIETGKNFEVTLARAERQDPSFNRVQAWSMYSIWMMTAQQLMQNTVHLQQARLGEDSRLAASGKSRALPLKSLTQSEDFKQYQKIGFNCWQELTQHWQQQLQSVEGIQGTVLLNISSYDMPKVDEIEQCLWWTVYDQQQNALHLRLDWQNQQLDKIRQLERITGKNIQVLSVFATVLVSGHQLVISPMSILINPSNKIRLFHLDFDQFAIPKKNLKDLLTGRIEQLLAKKKQQRAQQYAKTQLSLAQKICEPILEILLSLSCSGRMQLGHSHMDILQQQDQLAQDAGMSILSQYIQTLLKVPSLNAELILRLVYVCDVTLNMQLRLPIDEFS